MPSWLDTANEKLKVVNHKDFIPEKYLPTFSSHAIELNLHRIKGLAEQFVYFNDDIFLTSYVRPEDFFKNSKPCDTAALNCIFFGKDSAGHYNGSDLTLINSHFNKAECLKKNVGVWFNPKNGLRNVLKTLLLLPWKWFPGFYYQHAANGFLKSNFEEVWKAEPELLNSTCSHRFRKSDDLNQWAVKFWQLAKGEVSVRSPDFARCYHVKESNFLGLLEDISKSKYKMICINDTAKTVDFENKKQKIKEALNKILPEKSSFEI